MADKPYCSCLEFPWAFPFLVIMDAKLTQTYFSGFEYTFADLSFVEAAKKRLSSE